MRPGIGLNADFSQLLIARLCVYPKMGYLCGPMSDTIDTCLTRSDIAAFLQVSEKHAGQLMRSMKTIAIGSNQRRVTSADFHAWLDERREVLGDRPQAQRSGGRRVRSNHRTSKGRISNKGSVALAAEKILARKQGGVGESSGTPE